MILCDTCGKQISDASRAAVVRLADRISPREHSVPTAPDLGGNETRKAVDEFQVMFIAQILADKTDLHVFGGLPGDARIHFKITGDQYRRADRLHVECVDVSADKIKLLVTSQVPGGA